MNSSITLLIQMSGFTHDFSLPSLQKEIRPFCLHLILSMLVGAESIQDSKLPLI